MIDALRSSISRKVKGIVWSAARQALTELVKDAVREVNEETAAADRSAERTGSGLLLVGIGVAIGYLLGREGIDAEELSSEAGRIGEALAEADGVEELVSEGSIEGFAGESERREADDSNGRLRSLLAVVAVAGLAAAGYVAFSRDNESDDIGRRVPTFDEGSDAETSAETGADADVGPDTEIEDVEGPSTGGVSENEATTQPPDRSGYGSADADAESAEETETDAREENEE